MSLTANSTGKLLGTAPITYGSGSGVSNRELQGSATITYGGAPTSNTALSLPGTSGNVMNLGTFFPSRADPSTSNVFVEMWLYPTDANGTLPFTVSDGSTEDMGLLFNYGGVPLQFRVWDTAGSGGNNSTNTGTITINQWYHIAGSWDRTNNKVYGFVNGVVGSGVGDTTGKTARSRSTSNLILGAGNNGTFLPFNGYIRDFRMIKGGTVPTTSFTPVASAPFGPGTPTYVASMGTKVLSLYTDYFYPSFLTLPGTSGNFMNLGATHPSNFDTSASNLFCEAWIYLNSFQTVATSIIGRHNTIASPAEDWMLWINGSRQPQFRVTSSGNASQDGSLATVMNSGQWYHMAGSWDNTNKKIYVFLNGTASAATNFSGTARFNSTWAIQLGIYTGGQYLNGYVQDVRVTRGGIVPTATFTPTAAPFGLTSPSYASTGATVLSLATQYMQKVNTTVKSIPTLLSSISSGAAASAKGIYSLYAINGASPLVINVRNGTTAATSDFYGDTSGNLTTSTGQSISSWLGAATGFITTWYDQSGLGNHAAQVTNALQPSITLGTPNLINFGGTGYFTIANQVMPIGNGVFTTVTKLGTHPTASQTFFWNFGTTGSQGCVGFDLRTDFSPNRYEEFFYGAGDVNGLTYTPNATVSGVYNQSSHTLHLNGAQIGTSAVSSRNGIAGNQTIGAIIWAPADGRGTTLYTGTMRDLYVFSTALSTADRNIMENGYSPATPTLSYGRPLFSQLSTAAASSAVGAYSLRSVNGAAVKVAKVNAKYPTGTFSTYTSIYGVASASTEYPPGGDNPFAWKAFDGLSTSPNYWASGANYTQGIARTTGTVTVAGGTNYYGDWLQIQLPASFVPTGYALVAQQGIVNTPGTWYVFGSADGSTWTLLDTRSGIASATFTNFVYNTYTITGATTSYNYYRIVCNIVSVNTSFALAEFAVLRSSDFWADRRGNLLTAPVTGQPLGDWLQGVTGRVDTWYDQTVNGYHMSNTLGNQPAINLTTTPYSVAFTGGTSNWLYNSSVPLNFGSGSFTLRYVVSNNTGGSVLFKGVGLTFVWNVTAYEKYFWLGNGAGGLGTTVGNYPSQVGNAENYSISNTAISGKSSVVHKAVSKTSVPIYINGTVTGLTMNNINMQNDPGNYLILGRGGDTAAYIGNIFELQLFSTPLSDTDRLLLEN